MPVSAKRWAPAGPTKSLWRAGSKSTAAYERARPRTPHWGFRECQWCLPFRCGALKPERDFSEREVGEGYGLTGAQSPHLNSSRAGGRLSIGINALKGRDHQGSLRSTITRPAGEADGVALTKMRSLAAKTSRTRWAGARAKPALGASVTQCSAIRSGREHSVTSRTQRADRSGHGRLLRPWRAIR